MRTTLLPGILDIAHRNLARRNENLALFEIGSVFGRVNQILNLKRF